MSLVWIVTAGRCTVRGQTHTIRDGQPISFASCYVCLHVKHLKLVWRETEFYLTLNSKGLSANLAGPLNLMSC